MNDTSLDGALKTRLRAMGQTLDPVLKVGKAGLSPAFFRELDRHFAGTELIKLRFLGADRDERAALVSRIATEGRCHAVTSVGATAVFYRPAAKADADQSDE